MCPLAGTIDAEIHRVWLLGPPAAVAAVDAAVLPWLSALDVRNRCLVMNAARATGSCVCVCVIVLSLSPRSTSIATDGAVRLAIGM